jgi:hypothetical protein
MKGVVEMTLAHYDRFLERCDPSSKEYGVLKTGLIVRRPKGDQFERIVEIHCELEEARWLLHLARQIYPDAVADIEYAIANPRDS